MTVQRRDKNVIKNKQCKSPQQIKEALTKEIDPIKEKEEAEEQSFDNREKKREYRNASIDKMSLGFLKGVVIGPSQQQKKSGIGKNKK